MINLCLALGFIFYKLQKLKLEVHIFTSLAYLHSIYKSGQGSVVELFADGAKRSCRRLVWWWGSLCVAASNRATANTNTDNLSPVRQRSSRLSNIKIGSVV